MTKGRFEIARLQIGKNGLTNAFIEQVKKISEKEERIKITILKSACRDKADAKELCDKMVEGLGKNYTYRLVGYVCTLLKFRRNVRI